MKSSREEILKSMLKNANYYWYDETEDSINNQLINIEDYDPVIDTIFKANAFEIEKIYNEIDDSNKRIVSNLINTLIPDHSILPKPAYTIASINPKYSRLKITPEDVFKIQGIDNVGNEIEYYFTTLTEHQYPKCNIKYVLTDSLCIDYTQEQIVTLENVIEAQKFSKTKSMWIGVDIADAIEEKDELYFFLGNKILNAFDFNTKIFNSGKWYINGNNELPLNTKIGIRHLFKDDNLQAHEIAQIIETRTNVYEQDILDYFNHSFVSLTDLPIDVEDFKKVKPPIERINNENWPNSDKLLWINVKFNVPIENKFIVDNPIQANAIVLINRKLEKNHVVKSNYDRIVLPMPTEDYFLSINSVWDELSESKKSENEFYTQLDYINFNDKPGTFTIRSGDSIRRINQHDINSQILNLLDVIENEYSSFKEGGVNRLKEDFDAIEKSVNRIKNQLPTVYRNTEDRTTFYALANFRKKAYTIYYSYWETQGDTVNNIGLKKDLEVTSDFLTIDNSATIIPLQKGRSTLNESDFHDNLKKSILSRNSIVTIGDIENYCLTTYGNVIDSVAIKKVISKSNTNQSKYERMIAVKIKVKDQGINDLDINFIVIQIQNELNALASFYTPIKVSLL